MIVYGIYGSESSFSGTPFDLFQEHSTAICIILQRGEVWCKVRVRVPVDRHAQLGYQNVENIG